MWKGPKGSPQKKNTGFFLLFVKRGAGGSRPIQKILIRKYSDFFDQGGGSHPIQKGFIRKTEIFWHNLPKKGGFIKKNWYFFYHFSFKGHNVPRSKMCRKLGFFFNWTLLIIKMVLVMMVNWCAHFFCVWDPFWGIWGALKAPKISQNSGISDSVPSKPKWVEHWLNLVDHCISHSGGQFGSFGPIRNVNGRPQNGLKSALLAQMVLFGQRPSEQS